MEYSRQFVVATVGQVNCELQRKDQSEFAMMVTHSPIHNEHGEVVGLVQVSRDITAQKQAEDEHAKLLESERHARADAKITRIRTSFWQRSLTSYGTL